MSIKKRFKYFVCIYNKDSESYTLKTVDQCYGHQIPIICPKGTLVQIERAYYRQASYCPGDFHSNFCNKEETSNPACIGNQTCIFTTPWVYLSKECGYSNNFMVSYYCIPGELLMSLLSLIWCIHKGESLLLANHKYASCVIHLLYILVGASHKTCPFTQPCFGQKCGFQQNYNKSIFDAVYSQK